MAAAQEAREELVVGLGLSIGEGGDWLDWLAGNGLTGAGAHEAGQSLAALNGAKATVVATEMNGYPGFRASVVTNYTVGDSIIPGTESQHAKADATAVIKPRCNVDSAADPGKTVEFTCDGEEPIEIDPDDFELDDLPEASVLFSVHLAD
ncbi:hypothetical protein A7J05_13640 [Streptomyces alfalfae]|uniref:Uncharacterized protein n=1 Tax=Streptomyces alfalfae TaxID=1642299 RepID=A0ABM6H4H4_9ACTN|nr:hypothetical protein A7J05_13640 [Streptomyces alfalfae]